MSKIVRLICELVIFTSCVGYPDGIPADNKQETQLSTKISRGSVCPSKNGSTAVSFQETQSGPHFASQNPNHPLTVSFAYILIRIITYIMILNGMYQNTFSLKCKLFHDESFQISGVRYFYNIRSKMFSSALTE